MQRELQMHFGTRVPLHQTSDGELGFILGHIHAARMSDDYGDNDEMAGWWGNRRIIKEAHERGELWVISTNQDDPIRYPAAWMVLEPKRDGLNVNIIEAIEQQPDHLSTMLTAAAEAVDNEAVDEVYYEALWDDREDLARTIGFEDANRSPHSGGVALVYK